jgi:hypothetical protein
LGSGIFFSDSFFIRQSRCVPKRKTRMYSTPSIN